MLQITVPENELWDPVKSEFIQIKEQTLQLEHSLVSISKWESKWEKPYMAREEKTREEAIDYIRCMTITQNVNPYVYTALGDENIQKIDKYIKARMTATTINRKQGGGRSNEIVTSEVIYSWMISLGIPPEYEKWHLNRLLTLIEVCSIREQPPKKMSTRDIMSRNAALNAARRRRLNSKG